MHSSETFRLLVLVSTLLTTVSFLVGVQAQEVLGYNLGPLYECAHGLKGNVWVLNEKKIMITGFQYDGKGPAAWFHGQLKPASAISSADEHKFVTLPFPQDMCNKLTTAYKDENITLILPRSINDFQTIGILCYKFCHNFGHVIIPEDLTITPAPQDQKVVTNCPKPSYDPCTFVRQGAIRDCVDPYHYGLAA